MRISFRRRNRNLAGKGGPEVRALDERGQVLVIGLVVILGLSMLAVTVANVGIMISEKIHVQDTVDAAAYSSAVVEARYMNLSAYVNRAMVANYDSMAFNTGIWAVLDAGDHGTAVITQLIYQLATILFLFPITTAFSSPVDSVGDVFHEYVHHYLHAGNSKMNQMFAQDEDDYNQYIEMFNIDFLTLYEGLIYAATQSMRHDVAQKVAHKMDKNILTNSVLGLGAETVSYDELAKAVDYVIRDTEVRDEPFKTLNDRFDTMFGKEEDDDDHPLLLGAVSEASLDKFAAGYDRTGDSDTLRQFNPIGDLLGEAAAPAEFALDVWCYGVCIAECGLTLGFSCNCDCDAEISLTLGWAIRRGQENKANETRVPVIARQRMREANFFGLDLHVEQTPGADIVNALLGQNGHTSGEKHNDVANAANMIFGLDDGGDYHFDRAFECLQTGCKLNSMNIIQAGLMLPASIITPPLFVDDHWDGTWEDLEPVCSWQVYPLGLAQAECYPETIEYEAKVVSEGTEDGVPKYDWQVDVDNVGFANYHYPSDGATVRPDGTSGGGDGNLLVGPSIGVVGVKSRDKIRGMRGLGIGNEYSISALARSQVYYLRNPNRPKEKPSMFNPYWVARLAPLDNDDVPPLLRSGLPFVSSIGVPIKPTH